MRIKRRCFKLIFTYVGFVFMFLWIKYIDNRFNFVMSPLEDNGKNKLADGIQNTLQGNKAVETKSKPDLPHQVGNRTNNVELNLKQMNKSPGVPQGQIVTNGTCNVLQQLKIQSPMYQGISPDLREDEETSYGYRIVDGKKRKLLGESNSDPEIRNPKLKSWAVEMEKLVKDGKLEVLCTTQMTIANLSKGQVHCPCSSDTMQGDIDIEWSPPSWVNMSLVFAALGVEQGGTRRPSICVPRQKVAIIVPYKDRLNHLHIFMNHLHKFLVRQNMEYRVFVVEQAHPNIFNKAAMMNIAYLEAHKIFPFDCVIFHDVDILLENDRNLYACLNESNVMRHFTSHIDKYKYRLPFTWLIGGGVGFLSGTFQRINGYSTSFWGWGGEDNDLYYRIKAKNVTKIHRHPHSLARFTTIKHTRDAQFPTNDCRYKTIKQQRHEYKNQTFDGLSTMRYKVRRVAEQPLFTYIFAEFVSPLSEFFYSDGVCLDNHYSQHSDDLIQCAARCQKSTDCRSFQYQAGCNENSCRLFSSECEQTSASKHPAFVYMKGRSLYR